MNSKPDILPGSFDALLVANGVSPERRLLRSLADRTNCVIALDGGVESLRAAGIGPDHVVGDLDSAPERALAWAVRIGAKIHHRPSSNMPDIAKGLDLARKLGAKRVVVCGVIGERLDHILSAARFSLATNKPEAILLTDEVVAYPLRGRVRRSVKVPRGHSVSWFGWPSAGPCTLQGVRWPFANRLLCMDGFHSLSNEPRAESIEIEQRAGRSLLVISLKPQK